MIQHTHSGDGSLPDLFTVQQFVQRIRARFRRFGASMFGSAFAFNPATGLWARLPKQVFIVGIADKARASKIRFSGTLLFDQVPERKDVVDPWRTPSKVAAALIWKSKCKIESSEKAPARSQA